MQGWEISLGIAIISATSIFAVQKQKVNDSIKRDSDQDERFKDYKDKTDKFITELQKFKNETSPAIEHFNRIEDNYGKKIEYQAQEITKLNQQISQAPTMKEVRDEFVSKEMFHQMQKHIDEKFDKLEMGLLKILDKLEAKG